MRISGHEEYRSVVPESTENTRLTIFRLFVAWRERGRIFGRVGSRSRQTRNFHPHICCQKCIRITTWTIYRQLCEPTGNQPCCRQNGNRRVVMKIHKPATPRTDTDLFIPEPANRLTRTFLAISGKRHDSPFLPCPGVSYCSSTCRCFEDVIFNRRAISLRRKTLNVPIDLAIRASPFHISPSQ